MTEYRWPVIVATAVLALALFFGINYYRQRYMKEEPFIKAIQQLESVADAGVKQVDGAAVLEITPESDYRGGLQELVKEVETLAVQYKQKPQRITVMDRRNPVLDLFATAIAPDLYEGARLGNYRSVGASIYEAAERYNLEAVVFFVDYENIYLQARHGDYYLYQMIPLHQQEGGA
ncbi:MAG: hypothetical protein AB1767_13110 [Bacillota bacterium]